MFKSFLILGISFLFFSCGSEYTTEKQEEIDLKEFIHISPQEFIQNPLEGTSPKALENLPKNVDIIGKSVNVNVSLKDFKCVQKNGKSICVYGFNFINGKGGRIHFTDVDLPKNTKLYVFNESIEEVYTNQDGKNFWSINVDSPNIYIAYIYPVNIVLKKSPFKIDKVSYIWGENLYISSINPAYARPTECETIDINCVTNSLDEDKWKYAKSTAMIIISDDKYTYQCSGNLISSHKDKNDPILITAKHCFMDNDDLMKDAIFWFNYYSRECDSFYGSEEKHYVIGGNVLAKYKNDIALVEIKGSLDIDKYLYSWLEWKDNVKSCERNQVVGFSYPKENFLRYQEGYIRKSCYIESEKNLKVFCENNVISNGFETIWKIGSVDKGSSGSALLDYCKLDNDDYKWLITGVLSARNRGCNPANGIYADFFKFLKDLEEDNDNGLKILTEGLPDDSFEENDSFKTAFNTNEIFGNVCGDIRKFKKLVLKDNDDDWFYVYLPKGCKLHLNIDFMKKHGNLGVEIFDIEKNLIYKDNDEEEINFELLAYENKNLFIRIFLKDDTYQNYSIILFKERYANPPEIDVNTNLGSPIIRYRGVEKTYYTNKQVVNLFIDIISDFYNEEDLKICINRYWNNCEKWEKFKKVYLWEIGPEEGKYIRFVSGKTPNGRYTNFKKIVVYYDKTPPKDGLILYKKSADGILFSWKNFTDNLTGIDKYKLVYGEHSNISCEEGKVIYQGTNTQFLHKIKTDNQKYYILCAKDKAGNWSKGIKIGVK